MTIVPMRQLTIVSAAISFSTGARSSPWKVGSDATTSSADLASARLSLLGAKLAKSCSSICSTNCHARKTASVRILRRMLMTRTARDNEHAYRKVCAHSRPHHDYSHPSCCARARTTLCGAQHHLALLHATCTGCARTPEPRTAWNAHTRTSRRSVYTHGTFAAHHAARIRTMRRAVVCGTSAHGHTPNRRTLTVWRARSPPGTRASREARTHLQRDAVEDQIAEFDRFPDEVRAAVAQQRCHGEPERLHREEAYEAQRADRHHHAIDEARLLAVQPSDCAGCRESVAHLTHNLRM
jgi:hypothetical protein